ncbi:hypothetical protein DENSPDRAFT_785522 [Dentipellis sp. KUC8613]|nr:hypothetical protein DENSPDRAFT_785522 [Dentipellis sp. KUC8613]
MSSAAPAPPPDKPVRAIYIVGPSSTGKTTLCRALAAHLGLPRAQHITEVARADVGTLAMQRAIMHAQLAEDARARIGNARGIVLSDRSAVDAVVYAALADAADHDGGSRSRTLLAAPELQAALPAYRASTFVLLAPVAEWLVDDGVRSLEDGWACFGEFRRMLGELGIPFVELGSSCRWLEERVAFVRIHARLY